MPDHEERCISVGKGSMFTPISAMMTEALSFTGGMVLKRSYSFLK
jgi:hypothetical protein